MGQSQFMGKDRDRAAMFGNIFVQTNQPHYYAGENVTGKVYLQINTPYPGYEIKLKLKGKERTCIVWSERIEEVDPFDNQKRTFREIERVNRDEANCLYEKVCIYAFRPGQLLLPGQYEFPFSFMLPANVPGTFHQVEYRMSAGIAYTIEAFIEPFEKHAPKLKYKSRFTIREPIRDAVQTVNKSTETAVTCCCCKNYGTTIVRASFEKNAYCPNEEAHAIIQVDNTKCTAPIRDIMLDLKQILTIRAESKVESRTHIIVSRSIPGCAAGQTTDPRQASMTLPPSPDQTYLFVKDHGHLKSLPQYNGQFVNSTTTGMLIKSHFVLEAKANPDVSCTNTPVVSIPCHIVYPDYRFPTPQLPPGWAPQTFNPFSFSANMAGQYQPQFQVNVNLNPMLTGNTMSVGMNNQNTTMGMNTGMNVGMNTGMNTGMNVQMNVATPTNQGYPTSPTNQGYPTSPTNQGYPSSTNQGYPGEQVNMTVNMNPGFPDMGMNMNMNMNVQGTTTYTSSQSTTVNGVTTTTNYQQVDSLGYPGQA